MTSSHPSPASQATSPDAGQGLKAIRPAARSNLIFPTYPAIGLVGPASVGKDTVADYLVEHAGFRKYSFRGAICAEIAESYGLDTELLLKLYATSDTPAPRLALRQCGTDRFIGFVKPLFSADLYMDTPLSLSTLVQLWGDFRRHDARDYWLSQVSIAIREDRSRFGMPAGIILTHCTQSNEVLMVRGYYGGQIWQIERPGFAAKPGHASESSGAEFSPNVIIENSGTVGNLHVAVMMALAESTKGGAL